MKTRTCFALLCILILLLTFTACKSPVSVDDTGNTMQTNTPTTVTEPAKTTPTVTTPINTTTPETTEPSQSATEPSQTETQPNPVNDAYYPFIYKEGRQPHHFGPDLDLSKLTSGYLYVHNEETDEVYQIGNTEVAQMDDTELGYLYYRPADNSKIVRSDLTGKTQTVIYTSEAEITWFDYSADKLLIVENKKKMVLIDPATGTSEVISEQFCVNEAFYYPDASYFSSEDKGRTIMWHGYATETDELNTYVYHIDINEMYIPTWH